MRLDIGGQSRQVGQERGAQLSLFEGQAKLTLDGG
jgi:hypothetical protein